MLYHFCRSYFCIVTLKLVANKISYYNRKKTAKNWRINGSIFNYNVTQWRIIRSRGTLPKNFECRYKKKTISVLLFPFFIWKNDKKSSWGHELIKMVVNQWVNIFLASLTKKWTTHKSKSKSQKEWNDRTNLDSENGTKMLSFSITLFTMKRRIVR